MQLPLQPVLRQALRLHSTCQPQLLPRATALFQETQQTRKEGSKHQRPQNSWWMTP